MSYERKKKNKQKERKKASKQASFRNSFDDTWLRRYNSVSQNLHLEPSSLPPSLQCFFLFVSLCVCLYEMSWLKIISLDRHSCSIRYHPESELQQDEDEEAGRKKERNSQGDDEEEQEEREMDHGSWKIRASKERKQAARLQEIVMQICDSVMQIRLTCTSQISLDSPPALTTKNYNNHHHHHHRTTPRPSTTVAKRTKRLFSGSSHYGSLPLPSPPLPFPPPPSPSKFKTTVHLEKNLWIWILSLLFFFLVFFVVNNLWCKIDNNF